MKTYPIPHQVMQQIIRTLEMLPWGQVNPLMQQLLPIIADADKPNGFDKVVREMQEQIDGA
jgi:hypothetical protein